MFTNLISENDNANSINILDLLVWLTMIQVKTDSDQDHLA